MVPYKNISTLIPVLTYKALFTVVLIMWHLPVSGQLFIDTTESPELMLQRLFGNGVSISNLKTQCDIGSIAAFTADDPHFELKEGVMLSTGQAINAAGASNQFLSHRNERQGFDLLTRLVPPHKTYDACVFEFDIVPVCNNISVRYVFASEEYLEYVGTNFNDVFAFFISGPGITGDIGLENNKNIALVPGLPIPVTINNINPDFNPELFFLNNIGNYIAYDGYTVPLEARVDVIPCETYHMIIAITDVADMGFDSAVFLESGGIRCTTPTLDVQVNGNSDQLPDAIVENCSDGEIIFSLEEPLDTLATFTIDVQGTATPGEDYVPLPDRIVFPAGETEVKIPVQLLADEEVEEVEEIVIAYQATNLCSSNTTSNSATLPIYDSFQTPRLPDISLCPGDSVQLSIPSMKGFSYTWLTTEGISNPHISSPILSIPISYDKEDTLLYLLESTPEYGVCSQLDTMKVIVFPSLLPDFGWDTTGLCPNQPIHFRNKSSFNDEYKWNWEYGDQQSSNKIESMHTYAEAGRYEVALTSYSLNGCMQTLSKTIEIQSLPDPYFDIPIYCEGETALLTGLGNPSITGWKWIIGGKDTLGGKSISLQNELPATIEVELEATSDAGCKNVYSDNLTFFSKPKFEFQADIVCEGSPTNFSIISLDSSKVVHSWYINGSYFSSSPNVSYEFSQAGIHTAQLISENEYCIDTTIKNVEVYAKPQPDFSFGPSCQFDTMEFVNLTPDHFSGLISKVNWDFGDGTSSEEWHPRHIYSEADLLSVQLSVKAENGCLDSVTKEITIHPKPDVNLQLESVCAGEESMLSFTLSDSSSFTGSNWVWEWQVGTEKLPLSQNPISYTFDEGGKYSVSLLLSTDDGCTHVMKEDIAIIHHPEGPYITGDTVCEGETALLFAEPLGYIQPVTINWYETASDSISFWEGVSLETAPLFEQQQFYVELISPEGCKSKREEIIAGVAPSHSPSIFVKDTIVSLPIAIVNPFIRGVDGIKEVSWTFGEGGRSTYKEPAYQYQFQGTYTIKAEGEDLYGCDFELSKSLEVIKPLRLFIPTAFSPNGDGNNEEFFVKHKLLSQFLISIYDRWGKRVFSSNNPDFKWDGKDETGQVLPAGVYTFSISAVDVEGLLVKEVGNITLLR